MADRLQAKRESRSRIENHLALYRDGAPGFAAARKSIGNIAENCRGRGVPFVVLLFPLFANPLDERYPFGSLHEKIGVLSRSVGATFVDTSPTIATWTGASSPWKARPTSIRTNWLTESPRRPLLAALDKVRLARPAAASTRR